MADQPFIINDRRKFTAEGDIRPDAAPREPRPIRDDSPLESSASHAVEAGTESHSGPQLVPEAPTPEPTDDQAPPPPSAEELAQVARAYAATADRLDTAVRAMDPGGQHPPAMSFTRVVQSLYMQTLLQLGGTAQPDQQPHIDILGARQTIDMLAILAEKSKGNLSPEETNLIDAALFELRMGFLEVTQAMAQQAAQRAGQQPPPAPGGGPSIVR